MQSSQETMTEGMDHANPMWQIHKMSVLWAEIDFRAQSG